jgi:hypothetical protein
VEQWLIRDTVLQHSSYLSVIPVCADQYHTEVLVCWFDRNARVVHQAVDEAKVGTAAVARLTGEAM